MPWVSVQPSLQHKWAQLISTDEASSIDERSIHALRVAHVDLSYRYTHKDWQSAGTELGFSHQHVL
jgi:hypothetical protein